MSTSVLRRTRGLFSAVFMVCLFAGSGSGGPNLGVGSIGIGTGGKNSMDYGTVIVRNNSGYNSLKTLTIDVAGSGTAVKDITPPRNGASRTYSKIPAGVATVTIEKQEKSAAEKLLNTSWRKTGIVVIKGATVTVDITNDAWSE